MEDYGLALKAIGLLVTINVGMTTWMLTSIVKLREDMASEKAKGEAMAMQLAALSARLR